MTWNETERLEAAGKATAVDKESSGCSCHWWPWRLGPDAHLRFLFYLIFIFASSSVILGFDNEPKGLMGCFKVGTPILWKVPATEGGFGGHIRYLQSFLLSVSFSDISRNLHLKSEEAMPCPSLLLTTSQPITEHLHGGWGCGCWGTGQCFSVVILLPPLQPTPAWINWVPRVGGAMEGKHVPCARGLAFRWREFGSWYWVKIASLLGISGWKCYLNANHRGIYYNHGNDSKVI